MEVYLALSAKSGWLSPDALVSPGEPVQLAGVVDRYTWGANCQHDPPTALDRDFHLWLQRPGKLPVPRDDLLPLVNDPTFSPPVPGVYIAEVVDRGDTTKKATRRIDVAECGSWVSVGPTANTPQYPDAEKEVGRIYAMAVDPAHPDLWYVGAAHGGVWRSHTAGQYWYPMSDGKSWPQGMVVGRLAISPTANGNPSRIYASARYPELLPGFEDAGTNGGILASEDGGETWANPVTGAQNCQLPQGHLVQQILIDPQHAELAYVLTDQGVFRSTFDPNAHSDCWTDIGQGQALTAGTFYDMAVAVDGNHKTHLFISSDSANDVICEAVHETDDAADQLHPVFHMTGQGGVPPDGGMPPDCLHVNHPTWTKLAAAYDPMAGQIRAYAASTPTGQDIVNVFSALGADPWRLSPQPAGGSPTKQHTWYDLAIAANPTSPREVIFGTIWTARSTDAGATWPPWNPGGEVHMDVHAILFHPSQPKLLLGTDGGLFVLNSENPELSEWAPMNYGMATSMFYTSAAVARFNFPHGTLSGAQDNAHALRTHGRFFKHVGGADGTDSALDPVRNDISYLSDNWTDWIDRWPVANQNGGVGVARAENPWGTIQISGGSLWNAPPSQGALASIDPTDHQLYLWTGADSSMGLATKNCIDPTPMNLTDQAKHFLPTGSGSYFASLYDPGSGAWSIYLFSLLQHPLPGVQGPIAGDCPVSVGGVAANNVIVSRSTLLPSHLGVLDMALDPDDPEAVYVTTDANSSQMYGVDSPERVLRFNPHGNDTWDIHPIWGMMAQPSNNSPDWSASARYVIGAGAPMSGVVFLGTPNGMYQGNRNRPNPGDDGSWTWIQDTHFPPVPVSAISVTETGQLRAGTFGRGLWETVRCKSVNMHLMVADDFPVPGPNDSEADINVAYAGLVFATSSIIVDGIYNLVTPAGSSGQLFVQPLVGGVPSPYFTSTFAQVDPGPGVVPMRIQYFGTAAQGGVLKTDGLRITLMDSNWIAVAQHDVPIGYAWRPATQRALYVEAAVQGGDGGPLEVQVPITVFDTTHWSSIVTPGYFLTSPSAAVTVQAPQVFSSAIGQAVFAGWSGTGVDPTSTAGLGALDFSNPQMTLTLMQDFALRATYRVQP